MRAVTRSVAICSMMLACCGTLLVPLAAHAQGDAAAGEKIFAHTEVVRGALAHFARWVFAPF